MHIDRGSLCFSLFGIPIVISPYSWLFLAILGGGFGASSAADLRGICIFVVVGMVALLVHELGHALVGRALGGEPHAIVIQGLGAETHSTPPPGKWSYFSMVLAGPLATLLPALVAGCIFGLAVCGNVAAGVVFSFTAPLNITPPAWVIVELATSGVDVSSFAMELYLTTITVSVWWCLFNLLPVLPMDGGHLLLTLYPKPRAVCGIGAVLAALLAVWAVMHGYVFMLMLFAYFAFVNFRLMRSSDV